MYDISVAGLPTLQIATEPSVLTGPTESRMVPVRLRVDPGAGGAGHPQDRFQRARHGRRATSRCEEQSVFIVR